MTDSSDNENELPTATREIAKKTTNEESLPAKSREKYEIAYTKFVTWQEEKGTKSFNESILVAYFHDLAKIYKSSTLWSTYSMLRSMINNKHDINIQNYKRLLSFIKKNHVGYQARKSKTLSYDEVERFLHQASNREFLDVKVALIIGIYGACRGGELCNLTVDNVSDLGSIFQIKIPDAKTRLPRLFVIDSKYYSIIKEYINCRPKPSVSNRFFLNYRNGHCTNQAIGKNKIGTMPQRIAKYLGLDDPESYTGHSFRRSSATMLAEAGADMISINHYGRWKSAQVAKKYLDDLINNETRGSVQSTEMINSSVPRNHQGTLRSQSSKIWEVNQVDDGTSTSRTSTLPHENMTGKRIIGNHIDAVDQVAPKRLKPSSREEMLLSKVDMLQKRLSCREAKIQLLEDAIKAFEETSNYCEEPKETEMEYGEDEIPLKIKTEIKIEPDTVSYEQSAKEISEERRLPAPNSDVHEEFYTVMESIKFEEPDISEHIQTFDLDPTISSERHRNPRSKQSSKLLEATSTNVKGFPSLCRLCATRSNDIMVDIFSQNKVQRSIIEQIKYCLPITVTKTDNLTKQVCRFCLDKLEFCYQFHKSVVKAEKELLTHGKQTSANKISRIPSLSHREHDYTMHLDDEEESDSSFSWDPIDTHSTVISEDVKITDDIVDNDIISSDPQPCSVELLPTKIHHKNNPDERSATKINENENTHSTMNDLSSGKISASGIKQSDCFYTVYTPEPIIDLEEEPKLHKNISDSKLCSQITSCNNPVSASSENGDRRDIVDVDILSSGEVSLDQTSDDESFNFETIKCRICGETFETMEAGYNHAIIHASKGYYPCSYCNKIITNKKDWQKHKMDHKKGFKSESESKVDDRMTYKCDQCDKTFELQSALRFHKVHHKVITKLGGYCKICDKVVDLEKSLSHHMLTVHRRHYRSSDNLGEEQVKPSRT